MFLKRRLCVWLLVIVSPVGLYCLLIDWGSNEITTTTRMSLVKRRILLFAHQHDRLPTTLTEIPPLGGNFDNSIMDGWGRPIQYEVNDSKTVTLKSFGKDGVPGGVGKNADIVLSFPTHDADGNWSDPLVHWLETK